MQLLLLLSLSLSLLTQKTGSADFSRTFFHILPLVFAAEKEERRFMRHPETERLTKKQLLKMGSENQSAKTKEGEKDNHQTALESMNFWKERKKNVVVILRMYAYAPPHSHTHFLLQTRLPSSRLPVNESFVSEKESESRTSPPALHSSKLFRLLSKMQNSFSRRCGCKKQKSAK